MLYQKSPRFLILFAVLHWTLPHSNDQTGQTSLVLRSAFWDGAVWSALWPERQVEGWKGVLCISVSALHNPLATHFQRPLSIPTANKEKLPAFGLAHCDGLTQKLGVLVQAWHPSSGGRSRRIITRGWPELHSKTWSMLSPVGLKGPWRVPLPCRGASHLALSPSEGSLSCSL